MIGAPIGSPIGSPIGGVLADSLEASLALFRGGVALAGGSQITSGGVAPDNVTTEHPSRSQITRSGVNLARNS